MKVKYGFIFRTPETFVLGVYNKDGVIKSFNPIGITDEELSDLPFNSFFIVVVEFKDKAEMSFEVNVLYERRAEVVHEGKFYDLYETPKEILLDITKTAFENMNEELKEISC